MIARKEARKADFIHLLFSIIFHRKVEKINPFLRKGSLGDY